MRTGTLWVAAVAFVVASATLTYAKKCDPTGADAADVANARAAVAANCDCAGATKHGSYVSCAATQAKATLVNPSCKGAVVKCAAHSVCGKSGFVTCCQTNAKGVTKCKTKSSAAACKVPKGGAACVGLHSSCCDACTASGCASPSGAFLSF